MYQLPPSIEHNRQGPGEYWIVILLSKIASMKFPPSLRFDFYVHPAHDVGQSSLSRSRSVLSTPFLTNNATNNPIFKDLPYGKTRAGMEYLSKACNLSRGNADGMRQLLRAQFGQLAYSHCCIDESDYAKNVMMLQQDCEFNLTFCFCTRQEFCHSGFQQRQVMWLLRMGCYM